MPVTRSDFVSVLSGSWLRSAAQRDGVSASLRAARARKRYSAVPHAQPGLGAHALGQPLR